VRMCQQCQLVRSVGNVRSGDEQLKSILVCDLFYIIALDTTRHSYDILGAGMLWKPKKTRKFIKIR
jgi:hypothetical protein